MHDDRAMQDVDARAILATIVALALAIAAVCATSYGLLAWWHRPLAGPNGPRDFAIRPPVLESAPLAARNRFEAEKRALLEGYGWADRERGLARIPVERAMDLMASRGPAGPESAQ